MAWNAVLGLFLPCIYILMCNKTKEDYWQVFSYLLSRLAINTTSRLRFITTNFKEGLVGAVCDEFYWAVLLGCFFHFICTVGKQADGKIGGPIVKPLMEDIKQLTITPQHLIVERLNELEENYIRLVSTGEEVNMRKFSTTSGRPT